MIQIVEDYNMKKAICEEVLRDLPEWFGIEEATQEYIESVSQYEMFALYKEDTLVGFYSVREENEDCLDMYVLGVKKEFHRQGYGRLLQNHVFEYARDLGYKYCMVLTLSKSHKDLGYKKTRDFYHSMGFVDIYESNRIWDKANPTQIMVKKLGDNDDE